MNADCGPPHQLGWLRGPYEPKKRRIVTFSPRSSASARHTCSSKSLETAYAQRRDVGGPRTRLASSLKGGSALPYTSEVDATIRSASSARAAWAAALTPATLASSVISAP